MTTVCQINNGNVEKAGPPLRGARSAAPPQTKISPPKLPFPLRQFQDGGSMIFLEIDRKLREKLAKLAR